MTCKDCYHCEACENRFAGLKKICVDEPVKHLELNPAVEKCCENFKDKSRIIELPFIAMIEQYLVNGKFADNIYLQKFNGRYATVYIDKNKWGTPLIDICGKNSYRTEEAEERLKELNNGTT